MNTVPQPMWRSSRLPSQRIPVWRHQRRIPSAKRSAPFSGRQLQVSTAAHGGARGHQRLNTPNSPFFSQGAEETSFTS